LARSADGLAVLRHLLPLGDPTGQTAEREHDGEHVRRNAHRAVDDARVEVHVRVQSTLDEVGIAQSDFLHAFREFEHRIINSEGCKNIVRSLFDDAGTRVEILVDAVAEAHQAERVVLVFCLFDPLLEAAAVFPDGFEHLDDRLVCTAVERPPEGCNSGRYR